jgi:glutamate dehydrogenase (NAD(P)+)
VEVLFPSALEGVITKQNAGSVKARISVELANGPTTPDADKILHKNGVYVIPDFLANAGGVTVSYFEMVQNAYDYYWDVELVHDRLDKKMTANRVAAYMVAVNRVAEAMALRGWV